MGVVVKKSMGGVCVWGGGVSVSSNNNGCTWIMYGDWDGDVFFVVIILVVLGGDSGGIVMVENCHHIHLCHNSCCCS